MPPTTPHPEGDIAELIGNLPLEGAVKLATEHGDDFGVIFKSTHKWSLGEQFQIVRNGTTAPNGWQTLREQPQEVIREVTREDVEAALGAEANKLIEHRASLLQPLIEECNRIARHLVPPPEDTSSAETGFFGRIGKQCANALRYPISAKELQNQAVRFEVLGNLLKLQYGIKRAISDLRHRIIHTFMKGEWDENNNTALQNIEVQSEEKEKNYSQSLTRLREKIQAQLGIACEVAIAS